jgi:hypothetical protein
MRCGEEIDSEEAGMIGAMLDSQADEIAALRAALTTPPATPSDKQEATPIYQTWDDQKQAWLDQPEDYYRLRLPSNRRIVYAAPLAQSAEQNRIDAERAAWSAITGEAAAYIEDAANCLRDPDAKRAAEGAAEFVRKRRREILQDKGASK